MDDPRQKKVNRIDSLEKKLYSKNVDFSADDRSEFSERHFNAKEDWEKEPEEEIDLFANEPEKGRGGFFWTILFVAVLFFVGSIGYATYVFLGGQTIISGDDIRIDIVGPVSVSGGTKYSVDVVVENNGQIPLESVDLVIDYPDGTKTIDLRDDMRRGRITIGNLNVGSVAKETLDMAFLGENGEVKKIDVRVEYRIPGSLALFERPKSFEVVLSVAPVQVLVFGLEKISSGQTIELDLELRSNSDRPIGNLLLVATYPFGFNFENSSLKPTYGNNVWAFENFAPTDVKNIKITGQIQAQDGEDRAFRFAAGIPSDQNHEALGVTLTNTRHLVSIERPFLDLRLAINGSTEQTVVVGSGEYAEANISFINNTNDIVRDVEISLLLDGAVLNKNNITVREGFYDSFQNKIIYNKELYAPLAEVRSRNEVNMLARIATRDLSANNFGLKNPEIKISAVVTGQRVSEAGASERVEIEGLKSIKVLSDVILRASTIYNSSAGFLDFGPIPPRANTETRYTINWSVANSTNDLSETKVVGTLPTYVSWLDKINPPNENISYDASSRRITWNVGNVSAGQGFGNQAKSVSFQLSLRPSISQIGNAPDLINNVRVTANDLFTGTLIEKTAANVGTILFGRDRFDNHHVVVQ